MARNPFRSLGQVERTGESMDYFRVDTNPDMFGAGIGRAFQQAGTTITQLEAKAEAEKDKQAEFTMRGQVLDATADAQVKFEEAKKAAPLGDPEFATKVMKSLETDHTAKIAEMKKQGVKPEIIQDAELRYKNLRVNLLDNALKFQDQSWGAKVGEDVTKRRDSVTKIIQGDPYELDGAMKEFDEYVDSMPGTEAAEKAKIKADTRKYFQTAAGLELARREPGYVQRRLTEPGRADPSEADAFLKGRLAPGKTAQAVDNMKAPFKSRLATMYKESPFAADLTIGSGYRSEEEQVRIWNDKLKEVGGDEAAARKWVAKPESLGGGGSNHTHGAAVDIYYKGQRLDKAPREVQSWFHQNAERYGLKFPMGHEPWHVEMVETRGGGIRAPAQFAPLYKGAAEKHGVPEWLLIAQGKQESSFRNLGPNQKGAAGIAQFIPGTAAQYGVDVKDPASSIDGQARYMVDLKKQFGNWKDALAAYNWGPGNVDKWIKNGRKPEEMPGETKDYLRNILASGEVTPGKTGDPVLDNLDLPTRERVINEANQTLRGNQSTAKADVTTRGENAKASYANGDDPGTPPSRGEYISAFGDVEGEQRFADQEGARKVGESVRKFGGMTPSEIQTEVDSLKPTSGSATYKEENDAWMQAQQAAARVMTARQDDSVSYVMRHYPGMDDVDMKTPEGRTRFYAKLNTAYDDLEIPNAKRGVFDKSTLLKAKDDFANATPGQKAAFFVKLRQETGPLFDRALVQLADSGLGTEAYIAGLAINHPESASVAVEVFTGIQMMGPKDKGGDPTRRPPQEKVDEALINTISPAMAYMDGATSSAIRESATAVYVARGGVIDPITKKIDGTRWAEAMRAVLGGKSTDPDTGWLPENKSVTILPPGVTGKQFDAWKDGLNEADLMVLNARNKNAEMSDGRAIGRPVTARGLPVSMADIAGHGTYMQMGNNLYGIQMNGYLLMDAGGGPYIMRVDPEVIKNYKRPVPPPAVPYNLPPPEPPKPGERPTTPFGLRLPFTLPKNDADRKAQENSVQTKAYDSRGWSDGEPLPGQYGPPMDPANDQQVENDELFGKGMKSQKLREGRLSDNVEDRRGEDPKQLEKDFNIFLIKGNFSSGPEAEEADRILQKYGYERMRAVLISEAAAARNDGTGKGSRHASLWARVDKLDQKFNRYFRQQKPDKELRELWYGQEKK